MKLEEIAKLAGVSKATVSSVLNGKAAKYRISTGTQAKVQNIAKQYGYQPNQSAVALRRGSTHSIGLIVPDFDNQSYMRIAKRLEELARNAGYQLILSSSGDDPSIELKAANVLVARGVDALLVSSCLNKDVSHYREILSRGMPVIALDRPLTDEFCTIVGDDFKGALELTSSLDLPKIKNIVLIGAMQEFEVSQLREKGFLAATQDYDAISAYCFYGSQFSASSGASLLQLAEDKLQAIPDAIITTSFGLFEGVIKALQQHKSGNLVYADSPIQVGTFGNNCLLDFLDMKVNSLPQQYELIAESAWGLAKQAIDNDYKPQRTTIDRMVRRRH